MMIRESPPIIVQRGSGSQSNNQSIENTRKRTNNCYMSTLHSSRSRRFQGPDLMFFTIAIIIFCMHTTSATQFYDSVELSGVVDFASLLGLRDMALAYRLVQPDLTIDLTGAVAQDAFSAVATKTVDFSVLSTTISGPMIASAPSLYMLPLLTSAYVPIYRIDAIGASGAGSIPLTLSGSVLAMIHAGNITNWQDPRIKAINIGVALPNQPITIMVESAVSGKNLILKRAFQSFDSTFANVSGCQISTAPDWPLANYAQFRVVSPGLTQMVSAVTSVDGSIGMASQSTSVAYSASQAQMINKAGSIVSITPEVLTFAAVDLCLNPLATRVTAADLTDSSSANAWPLTFFNYLIISDSYSRTSCRARAWLVQFVLWTYSSSVALSLLNALGYAAVPDALLDQLDVIAFLKTQVLCRAVPALESVPQSEFTVSTLGIATALAFQAQLLTSVYVDPTLSNQAQWVVTEGSDNLLVQEMYNSEIDMILVNPDNVSPTVWKAFVESNDFLIVPMFTLATTSFFNPRLSVNLTLPTNKPFVLTLPQMADICDSCLNDFNDPQLYVNNPWLSAAINNQSFPIHMVAGCGISPDTAPLTQYLFSMLGQALIDSTATVSACTRALVTDPMYYSLFAQCQSFGGTQFERNEYVIPHLVMGLFGGAGLMSSDADVNKILPQLQVKRDGQIYNTKSDIFGQLACASDTFSASQLTFDFPKSSNVNCWPLTQKVVAVVRRQYYNQSSVTNHSSCVSGYESLEFLRWMITTQDIDALTDQANIGRLTNIPGVSSVYMDAVNSVLCDDETLLVISPIIWSLDLALVVLGYVVFILGVLMSFWLMGFTIMARKVPAVRAASPVFIIMSLCGVLLLFGGVLALVQPVTDSSCMAVNVLFDVGLILTFAPVTAKQLRIYLIFGRRRLTIVRITNRRLIGIVFAMVAIEACIVLPWLAVSPFQPNLHVNMEGSPSRAHHYTQCSVSGSGMAFFGIAAAFKGLLLISSAFMAFLTRKVSSQFNESNQIALAVYNLLFSLGIIAPVIYAVNAVGTVLIGLLLFVAAWIAFFTAGILVIPKVLFLYSAKETSLDKDEHISTPNDFEFLPLTELQSLPMIVNYLAALKAHSDLVDAKYAAVKKKSTQQEAKAHARSSSIAPGRPKASVSPAPRRNDNSVIGKSPYGGGHQLRHTRSNTSMLNEFKDNADSSPSFGPQQSLRNRGNFPDQLSLRANSRASM